MSHLGLRWIAQTQLAILLNQQFLGRVYLFIPLNIYVYIFIFNAIQIKNP